MNAIVKVFYLCLFSLLLYASNTWAENTQTKAYLLEMKGAIGPVSQDLLLRTLKTAQAENAEMVIVQLDTPGGLDHSMREMIRAILASETPVVSYVSPQGSRAASAGTYLLYASHIAAMAPATTLGAATPVQIGGMPSFPEQPKPATPLPPTTEKSEGEAATAESSDSTQETENDKTTEETQKTSSEPEPKSIPEAKSSMEKKIVNDAVAYIRGLAKLRQRNEAWAEQAVREAATLTAHEALEKQVIDIVAKDTSDLLRQLQGRAVSVPIGERVLQTEGLVIETVRPDWRSELLAIITNPNIAYILMLVGIYGLIIEFSNPGAILPGVVGVIALLIALYAFQVLPINYAGLALVMVGVAFIVAEVFVSSGGILGIGGVLAFIIGSVILFDDEHLAVSIPLIGGIAALASSFLFWVLYKLSKIRHKTVVSGYEYMLGMEAEVIADFTTQGRVRVEGESWLAHSPTPLKKGQRVIVKAIDGLHLEVEKQ